MSDAFVTIASTFAGGVLVISGSWMQAAYYRRRRIRSVRAALAAEVRSIVRISGISGYASALAARASDLRECGMAMTVDAFTVTAHQNYFTIYEQNADTIGDLPPYVAQETVEFYQAVRQWLDTLHPDRKDAQIGIPSFTAAASADALSHDARHIENRGTLLADFLAPEREADNTYYGAGRISTIKWEMKKRWRKWRGNDRRPDRGGRLAP